MPLVTKTSAAFKCNKHQGDPITEFSLTHQKCMCLRCATAQHDNFTDFIPISECVTDKREEAKTLLEQIAGFAKMARGYTTDRRKFVENLKQAEGHIKSTIKKVKTRINRHIDILENKLINNLSKLVGAENTSAKNVMTEIQVLEGQLNQMKEHIYDVIKRGNDVEVITTVVEDKNAFSKLRNGFDFPEEKIATRNLKFQLSPAISDFIKQVNELGDIQLNNDQSMLASPDLNISTGGSYLQLPRDTRVGSKLSSYTGTGTLSRASVARFTPKELFYRENGAVTMRRLPPSEIGYNLQSAGRLGTEASVVFTADHVGACNHTGVVGLETGLIVVCDAKHKCLQLVNRRSEILDDLMFHYTPCHLARVSDNHFAISFAQKDFISIFQMSNYRLKNVKDVHIGGTGGSYSIAACKNKIAVCRKGEIRIVSTKDDGSPPLQTIPVTAISPNIAMSDGGTRIYMTDTRANKVTCMSDLGQQIWEFFRSHMQPQSLALDLNQLFVADYGGRIFILSTYGDLIKVVTCGGQLRAVSVDPMSGNLLLTQDSREKIRSRTVKVVSV